MNCSLHCGVGTSRSSGSTHLAPCTAGLLGSAWSVFMSSLSLSLNTLQHTHILNCTSWACWTDGVFLAHIWMSVSLTSNYSHEPSSSCQQMFYTIMPKAVFTLSLYIALIHPGLDTRANSDHNHAKLYFNWHRLAFGTHCGDTVSCRLLRFEPVVLRW